MDWYLAVLKNYAEFSGRAGRQEYWLFFLFNVIVATVTLFVESLFVESLLGSPAVLYSLYCLAVLLPGIGVSVRRLHDTNRSGWWLLLALIPFGVIVILVLMALEGEPDANQYGDLPRTSPN
jgi:uncharacterized membrane protein YhaH (DUF805 family)